METEFQYQGLSGHVLSNNERSSLLISRPLLQEQYQGHVAFWGKVTGVTQDYIVCTVTGEHVFDRKYVCSTDGGLGWILLEPTLPEQRPYCDQIHGLFTGNPQYEYKIEEFIDPPPVEPPQEEPKKPSDEDEEAEEDEEGQGDGEGSDAEAAEEDEEGRNGEENGGENDEEGDGENDGEGRDASAKRNKTPQPTRRIVAVKELTRLAHFVEDVEAHCRVVPRGLLMLENDALVPNKFFQGLSLQDSGRLTHYLHSRPRKEAPKLGTTFTDCFDCLDSIVDDIPTGVWTLKYDPLFQLVVGNNLLFPGFTFYNKPNTATFGQYYFGSGERNLDICFML